MSEPGGTTEQLVLPVAQSIASSEGISQLLTEHYTLGPIVRCYLLSAGYNEVYELRAQDGCRYVARLGACRARGPSNTDYEIELLEHAAARGASLAAPRRPHSGSSGLAVAMPEGQRWLTVYEHVDGIYPESSDHLILTGEGLAKWHAAAEGYGGPPSRYRCDIEHLLKTPLTWLLDVPDLQQPLRDRLSAVAKEIEQDFDALGDLTEVACHGDCHGGNNLIRSLDADNFESVMFDFDDTAPGFLAYDLAVLLWSRLLGGEHSSPTEGISAKYNHYLTGYRRCGDIAANDLAAIPVFVRMRHVLWLAERASRRHQWGVQALPLTWLSEQADLLEKWRGLQLTTA